MYVPEESDRVTPSFRHKKVILNLSPGSCYFCYTGSYVDSSTSTYVHKRETVCDTIREIDEGN